MKNSTKAISKHEWQGFGYDKEAIAAIASEIRRHQESKRDYIYPVKQLSFTDSGKLVFAGSEHSFFVSWEDGDGPHGRTFIEWSDAEKWAEERDGKIESTGSTGAIHLSKSANSQLLSRLGVPAKFASELGAKGYEDVRGNLIRDLLQRDDRQFLVRTIDGCARAVLSDSYKIMDNADLFFASAAKFQETGAELWQARLWNNGGGFEMFGVSPHISGEISLDRTFDPGDGWSSRWYGKSGDVHNAAVKIRNSETGDGSQGVSLAIMRRVCMNYNVYADIIRMNHSGAKFDEGSGLLVSDERRAHEARGTWMKVQDAIATAFDETKFGEFMANLNDATTDVVPLPKEAVDSVVARYELSEDARDAILAEMLGGHDNSRFGVVQAVTSAAQKLSAAQGSELEKIGGEIAEMKSAKFEAMIAVA